MPNLKKQNKLYWFIKFRAVRAILEVVSIPIQSADTLINHYMKCMYKDQCYNSNIGHHIPHICYYEGFRYKILDIRLYNFSHTDPNNNY